MSLPPDGRLEVPAQPWVLLGAGTCAEVADVALSLGAGHVLLLTTGTWKGEVAETIAGSLRRSRIAVTRWSHESSNTTDLEIERSLQVFTDSECDAVLSLGGGSAHDTSKALRVLLANSGAAITDYRGRNPRRLPSMVPHIAVNTTSGTGAEVSNSFVYTDTRVATSPRKRFVIDRLAVPTAAINDPLTMLSQPRWLARFAGIDALTHAIEAFSARPGHALARRHAACAVQLIFENLERAADRPDDLSSMTAMCLAQYLAGVAFSTAGLGLVHAVSHALSAHFDLHHGVANGIALPYVLRYNAPHAVQSYAELAATVGLPVGGRSSAAAAELFVERTISLLQRLEAPTTAAASLGGTVVSEAVREDLVRHVMEDPCIRTNPRPVTANTALVDLIAGVTG